MRTLRGKKTLLLLAVMLAALGWGLVPAQERDAVALAGGKDSEKDVKEAPKPPSPGPVVKPMFRRPKTATTDEIVQWVKDLGDKTFKVRSTANKKLEEVGPAALKALREALKDSDLEVQQRARTLVERIEIFEALAPTFVDLNVKDASLPEAVAALSKQWKLKLNLVPQQGPGRQELEKKRVTLNLDGVPFWEALEKLCNSGGLMYTPAGADSLQLQLAEGQPAPPAAASGPFRMRLTALNYHRGLTLFGPGQGPGGAPRSESLTVNADVIGEPHIHILSVGAMQISEAVDDSGQSLVPTSAAVSSTSYNPYGGGPNPNPMQPFNTSFTLKPATKPSATLKMLRGSVPIEVLASRQPLVTVKNLMDTKGKLLKGEGGVVFAVLNVQDSGGGRSGNIRFAITGVERHYDPSRGGFVDQQIFQHRLEITDDQGRRHQLNVNLNYSGNPQDKMVEGTIYFNAGNLAGPADRLVFYSQRKARASIPFEFANVPMP